MNKEIVLGIDLGTGNSCMAIYKNGKAEVIPNAEGSRTTPSVIGFTKDGQRLVGTTAVRQAITNPKRTIHSIKRFIGKKYSDIKDIAKLMSYEVIENKNGDAAVKIDDRIYSPEEISSFVLAKLKADAEAYLGQKISKAVITVPAYFNDSQRAATKNAGTIAGLEVLRIINEPTAAALAYGIDKKKDSKLIAVYDLGQGTSDISILDVGDGVFEVLSTNGNSLLGGKDIDEAIVKELINYVQKEFGVDVSKDSQALQRITDAAEKAKCELSSTQTSTINIPFLSMNASGPIHLNYDLSRAKLESLISNVYDSFEGPCKKCIEDSGKSVSDITDVLMVGGSTRIPYLQDLAKKIFNKIEVNKEINPDECVAVGASIQAAVLAGDTSTGDVVLLDVCPISYGIETEGGIFAKLIENNTTIPVKKSQIFSTASDNQPAVSIVVYQGESKMCSRNKRIGLFNLEGIAPAPRGLPQIEVTLDLDANSVLTVTAKDLGTGKSQHVSIQPNGGLSKEEIEKLKKEAELHAEEDNRAAALAEAKNKAESLVYNVEKQIKDNADKISAETKSLVETKLADVKSAKETNDVDKINAAIKSAEEVIMKIGEEIYKNSQESANTSNSADSSNNTSNSSGPDVVDAEVVE